MKLNNRRTILVGLAFLSICTFWQMYDNIIPLILTNTFHLDETISGAIMAADNVLALFLLRGTPENLERRDCLLRLAGIDPAPGARKSLTVEFTLGNGPVLQTTAQEGQWLRLP